MAIRVRLDRMLQRRGVKLVELSRRVNITPANLSILKNNKVRALRISTLNAICRELSCQPGDLLEYCEERPGRTPEPDGEALAALLEDGHR